MKNSISNSSRPPQMTIEVNAELLNELKEIKRIAKISQSQLVREAVWEKIAEIKKTHPAFQIQTSIINSTTETTN